jgi:uncharacterized protein (TIGR03118 family)
MLQSTASLFRFRRALERIPAPNHLRSSLSAALIVASAGIAPAFASGYEQHNLVSDGAVTADHTDANLVNAWGIAFNPFGPVWVANNGTGTSTLYDGTGAAVPLIVQIPAPDGSAGAPTGIVFNASMGFVASNQTTSGPSRFLFATEQGTILGWAPNVDMTHAIQVVDNSGSGTIYKGIALSAGGSGSLLYATDFHNNRIDVFDSTFKAVQVSGPFSDPFIPKSFAPFGIQAINGNLYVTYAKQDSDQHDNVNGKGLGYVDVYDPNGTLLQRLIMRGKLNAPWGLALAPAGFGPLSNRLLVGNFGDGRINAYDLATGDFVDTVKLKNHHPFAVPGLWGLAFGNGFAGQPVNTLFFAAGPNDEANGLYGRIDAAGGSGGGGGGY